LKRKQPKFNAKARRAELQAFWSVIVRTRDKYRCQQCGCEDRHKIQAAHIFGKKAFPAIRFWPVNGVALCWTCHFKADQTYRHQFTFFCQEHIGEDKFDWLMREANKSRGTWGPVEYERDLTMLNEHAVELGIETI
jgi:hypothetical protein